MSDSDSCGEGTESEPEELFMEEGSDSDEEMEIVMTPGTSMNGVFVEHSHSFKALDESQLIRSQQREVARVAELLKVRTGIAGSLLRHFGWNVSLLNETYWADPEGTCSKAGIDLDQDFCNALEYLERGKPGTEFLQGSPTLDCGVCFCDYPLDEMWSMQCLHFFCASCWRCYLDEAASDGPKCIHKSCVHEDCDCILDETVWEKLASPETLRKYETFLMRSFVDDNPYIRWCPFPNCGRAIMVENSSKKIVRCMCSQEFCFQCMEENHFPASCSDVEAWREKEQDDSGNVKWIQANNIKKCPKCKALVEKIDGCMSMVCSQCQFNFCWMCLGPAHGHFFEESGCNRYKPDAHEEAAKQSALNDLQRYAHYYTRFMDHKAAEKFESDVEANTNRMAIGFGDKSSMDRSSEYSILYEAAVTLLRCRRTLKWSYVYAFFEENEAARSLFEFTQKELEGSTERLGLALKGEFDREELTRTTADAEKRRVLLSDPDSPFHKDIAGVHSSFSSTSAGGSGSSGRRK